MSWLLRFHRITRPSSLVQAAIRDGGNHDQRGKYRVHKIEQWGQVHFFRNRMGNVVRCACRGTTVHSSAVYDQHVTMGATID